MENYYKHLVEDLRKSYKDRHENTQHIIHPTGVVLKDVPEQYAHIPFEPMRKICEWMKLNPEAFPPADKWNEEQLKELCAMLRQLFEAYNYEPIIPFSLPFDREYTFLVKALEVEAINSIHSPESPEELDFCNEDTANCPFGEYCVGGDCWTEYDEGGRGWRKYD